MLSYWEREYFLDQPHITVVGSGIVGLTTALFIKKKHPDYEVVVAERGFLPDGASTRNAGFCCFGSVSELTDDLNWSSRDKVLELAVRRYKGLQLLTSLVGEQNMDYEPFGGYEIFTEPAEAEKYLGTIEEFNRDFKSAIGEEVYSNASHQAEMLGLKGVKGMILNRYEGQINTGKMMKTLIKMATEAGIKILFGMEVNRFEDLGTNVMVHTQNCIAFKTGKLLITTNGFAKKLLPELEVRPARAQVLITQPIPGLKLKGSFHYEQGYYYFRNVGNRVLLGGGRNLDFGAEETYDSGLTPLVQNKLESLLKEVILPGVPHEIDLRWSGTMGVGPVKQTIVQPVSENVCCGVRMGGMGVALGSLVGKELSDMV